MIDWNEFIRLSLTYLLPAGAIAGFGWFFLSHKPTIRNMLTREFFVSIEGLETGTSDDLVLSVNILIRITCRNSEPVKIVDAYFQFDDTGEGLDRYGVKQKGRHYIEYWDKDTKGIFTHSKSKKYSFMRANNFLQQFEDGRISEFKVVIETNKYGVIRSEAFSVSSFQKNTKALHS